MPSAPPSRLGKYDLLARIAKGGMAEIFLARQRGAAGFSRLVVLKRILPHLADEPQFVRMFLEEARVAALVNHPNVVQIYDVDQAEGDYYIAMEHISGPSLSTIIRHLRERQLALPCALAGEIVCQACAGLHAAHELREESGALLQLVHRDVSPHNLMVNEAGVVKLVDFGIAKAKDSSVKTRTGNIRGKYPYMSPEQCAGEPLDRRTDLFSLGAVFWELVVGQRLFQRATELMTLKAITEEPIPLAHERRPDLPAAFGELISRCLERERERRFASAAEMGQAVRATLEQLGLSGGPGQLAEFLGQELHELLASRAEALRQASKLSPRKSLVPVVEGLASGSHSRATVKAEHPGAKARSRRDLLSLRRWLLITVLVLLLSLGAGLAYRFLASPPRPRGPALLFGMAPSFPEQVMEEEMRPLLSFLEQRLQRRLELKVVADYRGLHQQLLAGKIPFAHLPPLQYVLAREQRPGLQPLASHLYEGTRSYQALLIARDDSGIAKLEDVKGKRFCYVDPESTSGYLLPRHYLRSRGLDPDKIFAATRMSGNHVAVMKDILAGRCEAGAVYSGAMIAAANLGLASSRLWHLAVTGQLPHEVICAADNLPPELAARMQQALLELEPQRHLGQALVGKTMRISGFAKTEHGDFELVERAARSEGLIK